MNNVLEQQKNQKSQENKVNQTTRILIVGVGLIGGSFAGALRANRANVGMSKDAASAQSMCHIVGVDRDTANLAHAMQCGLLDEAYALEQLESQVSSADWILIATPVSQTQHLLARLYPHLAAHTLVMDTGSTKCDVVQAAHLSLQEKVSQFIPCHPIAGREHHGAAAALPDLFLNKKVVLCALPENAPSDVAKAKQIWQACGAVVHELDAQQHDAVFASVSHLPHLLAYNLVNELAQRDNAETLFDYAASGFRDFTRIASSSPEMWADISMANRDAILQELAAYLTSAQSMYDSLLRSDKAQLQTLFSQAQAARAKWLKKIEDSHHRK